MKRIIQIMILILITMSVFAQERKNSIEKKNKMPFFIDIQFGSGLGWRNYEKVLNKKINDSLIRVWMVSKNEKPGLAYNFNLNWGFSKRRWQFMFGIEYYYIKYYNNSNNTINPYGQSYRYSFIHKLITVPFNTNYYLGKDKGWYVGGKIEFSWLLYYHYILMWNPPPGVNFNPNMTLEHSYPILFFGVLFGKRLIETKKLKISIEFNMIYSTVTSNTGESYNTPRAIIFIYESKPHHLLVPSIQFNLQYKL